MAEGADNIKELMRNALSSISARSKRAITQLNSRSQLPPPPFAPHFITFILTIEYPHHFDLSLDLLNRILSTAPQPSTSEKLKSATASLLKNRASTRHAVTAAKLACYLLPNPEFSSVALSLLIAAIAALERSHVPESGPQLRTKRKASSAIYSHAIPTVLPHILQSSKSLFDRAERYSKAPYESVAAIALLSACYFNLSNEEKDKLLIILCTVCMKSPQHSRNVISVSSTVLCRAKPEVVVSNVIPIVEKSLVREPESALLAASRLFKAMSPLDISTAVSKNVLPALVQAVKSTDANTRSSAVSLSRTIAPCVTDETIAVKIVTDLASVLKGSRYVYQRMAVYESLYEFMSATSFFPNANDFVMDSLRNWLDLKKETKEDARLSALNTLVGSFARVCGQINSTSIISSSFDKCATFLLSILSGNTSESDQRAVLSAITTCHQTNIIPETMLGENIRTTLASLISSSSSKNNKQDIALNAMTVLCDWSQPPADRKGSKSNPLPAKVNILIGDPSASPALALPKYFLTLNDAICAVRCCIWMINSEHESIEYAMASLFRLCLDERNDVHAASIKAVQSVQTCGNSTVLEKFFHVLWSTQFSGGAADETVAKTYDFDDGMMFAEKLGLTLLSVVIPKVVPDCIPQIILAANHPRLCPYTAKGRVPRGSRYWAVIAHKLGPVDADVGEADEGDWLDKCLEGIFGENGLQSNDGNDVTSALNSLAAICDESNSYSVRALRRSTVLLRSLALETANLSNEAFSAIKLIEEMDEATHVNGAPPGGYHKSNSKKLVPRQSSQEKQAKADRARAAAANANAMAGKVEKARALAETTKIAVRNSKNALFAIATLAKVSVKGTQRLMSKLLPLVIPLIKFEMLGEPCRNALYALSNCVTRRLRGISTDISTCLFGLERGSEVESLVASIILSVKAQVPPALSSEDFILVAPIVRAALLKDPYSAGNFTGVGRQAASNRREAVSLVKAAAQILVEHCSPEAVDSAVSAAAVSAGSWLIIVLEREDGAFAVAADALALLTGTALTPGTQLLGQTLEGIYSGKSSVRDATLASLARLPPLSSSSIGCPRDSALGRGLWLTRFDPDEANVELADELWDYYGHPLHAADDVPIFLELLSHKESDVRTMCAKAIANALQGDEHDGIRSISLPKMFKTYSQMLPSPDNEEKEAGMRRGVPPPVKRGRNKGNGDDSLNADKDWEAREGIALALEEMAILKCFTPEDIQSSFSFLAGKGLGDENDKVRARMAKAAIAVVGAADSLGPTLLLPLIESQLNSEGNSMMKKEQILHADRTRENLVMCLGSVARFLPAEDPRVVEVSDQVMRSAMETPSEVVQNAAARCLSSLANVAITGEREIQVTKMLLSKLWDKSSNYGQRRGAAYSLGGISGGLGLRYVKRALLKEEIDNAFAEKSSWRRQGAFLLIETSALMMGRVFEPYVVTIVPFLLSCMSDSVVDVRNACWAAAQAAMSELSSQGVKMVLPSLVEGLKDRQWRTRAGSAEVLGAMAYCAPRQLAQCLPQVVPKLAESLADAHPSVVDSAESAINRIAAVVRSPEVRKLSPFLLAALRDPAGRTRGAVDAMLGSEFVHAIDAASLSLLIPPLHRGLRDRSYELKKRSAAIVGSMCNNVSNPVDVVPYLNLLLPALRITLLDAIPDVRRTSSRALGALAVSLGEKGLHGIVSWLISALLGGVKSNETWAVGDKVQAIVVSSSAERSGAAMGLAEVSASMSEKRLEEVLSRVLMAGRSSSEAREGGLMLIASMPRALGDRFEVRIGISLSAILQGLADDADIVREAALEAGRNLVSAYAKTSLERLMPELLRAMREKLWRIRQAATRLLGDMLLVIAGARPDRPDIFGVTDSAGNDEELKEDGSDEDGDGEDGEETDEDDEDFESPEDAAAALTVEAAMNAIEDVLGLKRRNEVLAALYIARCDVSVRVRQTAMQVWKSVVSNTPRVLREIMPSAVRQIVDGLGDEDEERRGAAGKTLGDLAQKLGDHVVPEVLPALRSGITSKENSDRIRRGACEGLGELVFACPKQQLEAYADNFIDAVHQGLSDKLVEVRRSAADVFASLLKPLGTTAVDAIVPRLIESFSKEGISREESNIALDGLSQILRSCGSRLTSIVVPRLFEETPLSGAACKVLATAAVVSGPAFEPYVIDLTDAVVDSMEALDSLEKGPLDEVLIALSDCGSECVKLFADDVISKFNEGYPDRRVAAARVFEVFARSGNRERVNACAVTILEVLIRQFADTDEGAATAAWGAWRELCDAVSSTEMSRHIPIIRQSLRAASSGITEAETILLGLQVPKSLAPFVPVVTEGLLNGAPELKEQAALCISELIELTTAKILAPFVIKLTGPLIRSLSGRVPWQVKAAIIKALHGLIKNGTTMVRSFVPQLQGSFVKNLSDGSRLVRVRACSGLSAIIPLQNRLEPLLNDLVSLGINGLTPGPRSAAFRACSQVFRLGKKLPDNIIIKFGPKLCNGLMDEDEEVWRTAGKCIGFMAERSENREEYEMIISMVRDQLNGDDVDMNAKISILRGVGAVLLAGMNVEGLLYDDVEDIAKDVMRTLDSTIAHIRCAACATVGELVMLLWRLHQRDGCNRSGDFWRNCVMRLDDTATSDDSSDVRIAAVGGLKNIMEVEVEAIALSVDCLVSTAGATNTGIREEAEKVMRKVFFIKGSSKGNAIVDGERLNTAKGMLSDEDAQFLDRKVRKVSLMRVSDEDKE